MECQICTRHQDAVPGFNCPACARASLYALRNQHAHALLDKARFSQQVQKVMEKRNIPAKTSPRSQTSLHQLSEGIKTVGHAERLAEIHASGEKTDAIAKHVEALRKDMLAYKDELQQRKTRRDERKQDLAIAKASLRIRQKDASTLLSHSNRGRIRQIDTIHEDIILVRISQCKRAASLMCLKELFMPVDAGKRGIQYYISHLQIPDIRHLNNTEPAFINGMFQSIVRLVYQTCLYLRIRLPAEMVLPYAGYPWPSIYTLASSYVKHEPLSRRKILPLQSRESSIKNSRDLEQRGAGRPRHLSTDKKLPRLAKENSVAYALLVEGMALLAWDIAWLCRTQGLPVAEKNWEDVSDIGRNLWLLFCTQPHNLSTSESCRVSRLDPANALKQARGGAPFNASSVSVAFGIFSHGSVKNNLESPKSSSTSTYDVSARGWAFANPVKIFDELRAALLTEMSGHDWELLDDRDSEAGDNTSADETIMVDSKTKAGPSGVLDRTERTEGRRGASGWTKLKSRPAAE